MNENKNILSPERQIMVLGPRLEPLAERMGRDRFDGEVTVMEKKDLIATGRKYEISEQQLIDNYFDFLADVREVASQDDSERGNKMQELAERFAADTTYLSVADRRAAIRGLGTSQIDYLGADDTRRLFFFVPERWRNKSQDVLTGDMKAYMTTVVPELEDRIQVLSLESDMGEDVAALRQADPKHAKIVILDDWSATGNQLENGLGLCQQLLAAHNLQQFRENLEVNLLVARTDQIMQSFRGVDRVEEVYDLRRAIPFRTFYTAKGVSYFEGPMPTGAHSSVDYGFESPISEMRDYLAVETGDHDVLMPYMAAITKSRD